MSIALEQRARVTRAKSGPQAVAALDKLAASAEARNEERAKPQLGPLADRIGPVVNGSDPLYRLESLTPEIRELDRIGKWAIHKIHDIR